MDNPSTTNITTSGTVRCTPQDPNSKLNTAEGSMPACEAGTLQVTMGMFFDGTGNNKFNTDNSRNTTDDSYGNSYSNVARAWQFYKGSLNGVPLANPQKSNDAEGHNFNVYVEGIGTKKDKEDSGILGFGLGQGLYGISARVIEGGEYAAKTILESNRVKDTMNIIRKIEVTFDVFGFSRGAAAARHFISLNTQRYPKVNDGNPYSGLLKSYSSHLEYSVNQIFKQDRKIEVEIHWRFAGLYETVSSHGLNRSDDVGELGLDQISQVKSVVQIAAEDEYREKFSLTNVNSHSNARVITLPGAHSDIGGGYSANNISGTQEKDYVLYFIEFGNRLNLPSKHIAETNINVVRKWFIDNGWYKDDSRLIIETRDPSGQTSGHFKLKATRTGIKNVYSHIPLHIMTKQAIANGVNFDTRLLSTYPIESGILSKIYNSGSSGVNLNTLNSDELLTFRYEYLHWSSRLFTIAGGHDPRIVDSEPNYPKYKRETHPG